MHVIVVHQVLFFRFESVSFTLARIVEKVFPPRDRGFVGSIFSVRC